MVWFGDIRHRISPIHGCTVFGTSFPGLHPGLSHSALLGRRERPRLRSNQSPVHVLALRYLCRYPTVTLGGHPVESRRTNRSTWQLYPGPSALKHLVQLSWAVGPGWDGYGPLALETESEWMRFGPPCGRDVRVPKALNSIGYQSDPILSRFQNDEKRQKGPKDRAPCRSRVGH